MTKGKRTERLSHLVIEPAGSGWTWTLYSGNGQHVASGSYFRSRAAAKRSFIAMVEKLGRDAKVDITVY